MNEKGNTLFLRLRDVPIVDRYADPKLPKKVLTNITELLRTPQKDRIISLFLCDEKRKASTLSDFEYLKALSELLPDWIGTREGTLASVGLAFLYGKSFDLSDLKHHEFLRELWEIGNEKLLLAEGKYENILKENGVEKLYQRELAFGCAKRVEKYKENENTLSLLCDFRGLPFCRPDPYHAACAEKKYEGAEPLTDEEQSILATQALYRLCSQNSQHTEIRLLADADGKTAAALIAYLKRLSVRGTLWIAADGCMSTDTLLSLCDTADDALNIRPEIVLGPYDSRHNAEQRLHLLAARYPITRWHFGGVLGEDPLFFVGHTYMRKIICCVIAEIVDDPCRAEQIARQIFAEA